MIKLNGAVLLSGWDKQTEGIISTRQGDGSRPLKKSENFKKTWKNGSIYGII